MVPAILSLPITSVPPFTITATVPGSPGFNTVSNVPVAGGNFLGTFNSTPLAASYGLNPAQGITVGTIYYTATETNNGTIYGNSVPNAGAVAWLLVNRGPLATTPIEQSALQAAIWRAEFGSNFDITINNNPTLIADYLANLAALDGHTLPLGSVMWITPESVATTPSAQVEGIVAVPPGLSTQTTIDSSLSQAAFGQPVTFGALVTNTSGQGGTPTGSVQFQVDGINIGNPAPLSASGTANFTETTVSAGSHTIGAVYEPTGNFGISASVNHPLTVSPTATAVVISSSANPAKKGKPISLLVTVKSASPGSVAIPLGTVVFNIDGHNRPAVNLFNGHAVRKGFRLSTGHHTITVYYTPLNGNYLASQNTIIQTFH
jgi:hypothetical protein